MNEPMKSEEGLAIATCKNDVFFILSFLHCIATFLTNLVSLNNVPLIPRGFPQL